MRASRRRQNATRTTHARESTPLARAHERNRSFVVRARACIGAARGRERQRDAEPMPMPMVLPCDRRSRDALTSSTSSSSTPSYGTDVERGASDFDRASHARAPRWRRAAVATVSAMALLALGVGVGASTRGSTFRPARLGVQPDARGVAPPESEGFVRSARRNYGAALMRASYHQTREVGEVDTAEEADALADRDALADIVDEEFYDDADDDKSDSSAGSGEHPAEVENGETMAEKREKAAAAVRRSRLAETDASSSDRGASKAPSSGGGNSFLSRANREEALKNQRRRMRREAREAREARRAEEARDEAEDKDGQVDADVPSEDVEDEDQKYYKSINGGWFHVKKSAKNDKDADGDGEYTDGDAGDDDVVSLHNSYGEIPGLLDHLKANGAQIGQMRVVTYANSAYWPVAKLLIDSARRNAPGVVDALTVMVTDRGTLKECVETGVMCFLDTDMIDVLGEHMNTDGSISAGRDDANGDLGKALRIVWTWRKVHVVYTLVQAGYGCLFLDASTVLLNDPRELVRAKLDAGALLVTLSDFGGQLEQKAINTGLIAARPNEYIGKLLEDWMKLEPDATDTEQAALTWNIAPNARADGVIITALSQAVAPSYLTFDVNAHMNRDSGQFSGYLVHAAYCGSVAGKIAFLNRVERLSQDSTKILPVSKDEERGCDVFDRHKFFSCGLAPWDGICQ